MSAQWKDEKFALEEVRKVRTRLEDVRHKYEDALMRGDNEMAARLKYGEIPELEKKLRQHEEDLQKKSSDALLSEEVTAEEIAEVVSRWSGIPVTKLVEGEREKLIRLGEILHHRVIMNTGSEKKRMQSLFRDWRSRDAWCLTMRRRKSAREMILLP